MTEVSRAFRSRLVHALEEPPYARRVVPGRNWSEGMTMASPVNVLRSSNRPSLSHSIPMNMFGISA